MKAVYLAERSDKLAQELDAFLTILELSWGHLFGRVITSIDLCQQETLQRPAKMPLEDDIKKLCEYNISEINKMLNDLYTL